MSSDFGRIFSSNVRSSEEHSAQDTPRLKQKDGEKLGDERDGSASRQGGKYSYLVLKERVNCAEKRGVEHKFFGS
jgi:hypothetical protein